MGSKLDSTQVLKEAFDDTTGKLEVLSTEASVGADYDHQTLTYVTAGNGIGEVGTITYRTGGAAGTIVATVTLTYDASNRVSTIARV